MKSHEWQIPKVTAEYCPFIRLNFRKSIFLDCLGRLEGARQSIYPLNRQPVNQFSLRYFLSHFSQTKTQKFPFGLDLMSICSFLE